MQIPEFVQIEIWLWVSGWNWHILCHHLFSGFMESPREKQVQDRGEQSVFHIEQPVFHMVWFESVEIDCGKRNKEEDSSGTILV